LPDGANACLFDLDGMLTQTAKLHAAAGKQMFDANLRELAVPIGHPWVLAVIATLDEWSVVDGRVH
jgi:beta-phosphoglucomutase-like phosphatase (HAD superfamily)